MKNIFTKVAVVAAFGLAVGYTTYNSQEKSQTVSDLLLDNVEALAYIEGWIGNPQYHIEFHQMWHWTCHSGGYLKCPI